MLPIPPPFVCVVASGAASDTPAAANVALPAALVAAIRSADEVRFVTRATQRSITTLSAVQPLRLLELTGVLAGAEFRERGLAWCGTGLDVEFWQKGKRMCTISPLGTPDVLRCQIEGSLLGDFAVGTETATAFTTWVDQELRAAPKRP